MIHTRGLVAGIDNNGDAIVIMDRANGCSECSSSKTSHCEACLSGTKIQARALNEHHAEKGDIVSVSFSTEKLLKGAAALYLIPVAGVIIGAFIGSHFHEILMVSDSLGSIIIGFIGILSGFFIVRLISKRMNADQGMMPVISKIIYSCSEKRSAANSLKTNIHTCSECK